MKCMINIHTHWLLFCTVWQTTPNSSTTNLVITVETWQNWPQKAKRKTKMWPPPLFTGKHRSSRVFERQSLCCFYNSPDNEELGYCTIQSISYGWKNGTDNATCLPVRGVLQNPKQQYAYSNVSNMSKLSDYPEALLFASRTLCTVAFVSCSPCILPVNCFVPVYRNPCILYRTCVL